ncbi:pyridoxal phosphate-dependent transferase [Leptodontidium sp. 2 PMI_412]|nr:pyridoxal phosphate-dependent transferase [Leptodontidium sp. 2 PMI_412]
MTSIFSSLPIAHEDDAFGLIRLAKADTHPSKTSLNAGVYRDEEGNPWVLPVVKEVKNILHADPTVNHEYLPIRGNARFLTGARKLVLGAAEALNPAVVSIQTVAGTGANHMAAILLVHALQPKSVWFSNPTWLNHASIWEKADKNINQKWYPYYNPADRRFDFRGMVKTLEEESQPGDVVVLHACAHNPTGLDPTPDQWKAIADLCIRLKLFPLFDSAYQGFASGDLERDSWAIKHFLGEDGLELGIAQSFSKNFGLYAERVGALHIRTTSADVASNVGILLQQVSRSEFSTPPAYGATIVATVLNDDALFAKWQLDLKTMSSRIAQMRQGLYDELIRLKTPGKWDHILTQIGMFSYIGVTAAQAILLKEQYHIYLLTTGRVALTGLTWENVGYVASSIDAVVRQTATEAIPSYIIT